MKKHIIAFAACILFSCKPAKIDDDQLYGVFYKNGRNGYGFNFEYKLVLNKDKTFMLTEKFQDAAPGCHGKWEISNDSVTLLCSEQENVYEQLTNGYMNKRVHKLKVINSNNLEYEGVTLERIEQ